MRIFLKLLKNIQKHKVFRYWVFENTNGKLEKAFYNFQKEGRRKNVEIMTKEKIENEKDLKKFNYDGYYFVNEMSTDKSLFFLRDV